MTRATVRRVWIAIAFGFVCALVVVRPHVVQRYGLYLGSPASASEARLYLDPFPDAQSCESRVAVFTRNAENAFCASSPRFETGTAIDAVLDADFRRLFPAGWYCEPTRRRFPNGRAAKRVLASVSTEPRAARDR